VGYATATTLISMRQASSNGGRVMSNSISDMNLAAALALVDAGFRVFPARAIYNSATKRWNKPPCVNDWQARATTDHRQIIHWWRQHPEAIPAITCDHVIVIDADRHPSGPDGVEALAALAKCYGEWIPHPVVMTPSNGEHHYFAQSNPGLGNRTGQLPLGIDVRGLGGFVIGPGAVLSDGTEWRLPPDQSTDLPKLPQWLEQMIRANEIQAPHNSLAASQSITPREQRYAESVLEAGTNDIATAVRGRRNITLNNVAYRLGRMAGAGWIDRRRIENSLRSASFQLENENGLSAVMATIKSGLDAGMRKPHSELPDRAR
jgi:hypothetical protein